MTESPPTPPASFNGFGDNRDEILSRAQAAKLKTYVQDLHNGGWRLAVEFPNGVRTAALIISPRAAFELCRIRFENWQVLGHYQAIYDPSAELIEARIDLVRDAALAFPIAQFLSVVDGFEHGDGSVSTELHDKIDKPRLPKNGLDERRLSSRWRLEFAHDQGSSLSIELNSGSVRSLVASSDEMSTHDEYESGRLVAIQISGSGVFTTDDPLRLLEEIAGRTFFEIQVKYGAPMNLKAQSTWRTVDPFAKSRTRPRLTTNRYRKDAIALYLYGLSLSRMPIDQYLAYYQATECFFTQVLNADVVAKIKREVSDPRFNPADKEALTSLATTIQANGPRALSEKDQLHRVIERCVDGDRLAQFLSGFAERRDYFTSRDKLGGNISTIQKQIANTDERAKQVAYRIYDIRCRIVHTKADRASELRSILPLSPASRELGYDIELVRFVAEETILGAGID